MEAVPAVSSVEAWLHRLLTILSVIVMTSRSDTSEPTNVASASQQSLAPPLSTAISAVQLAKWKEEAKGMFYHGYDNYMQHAYPLDELDPVHCTGRGPDYGNPQNININDVLGNYSLTMIDSLDMLAMLGNWTEFDRNTRIISKTVSFDQDSTVQVFEASIRVMGGLLSAHLIASQHHKHTRKYDGSLLNLALDLGKRLLPGSRIE